MAFRFWRRMKIAPGVTLNLSKSGGSLSFGPRGAKFTAGPRGRRATLGLPGTGLFYTTTFPKGKSGAGTRAKAAAQGTPAIRVDERLNLGFFQRLITPDDEQALVAGFRELALGHDTEAFSHLKNATHLADGAFLAGFLALGMDRLTDAERYLKTASAMHDRLGHYVSKYGLSIAMSLPITDEITVHVGPDIRAVLLGLVEVYQRLERWRDAGTCLERLRRLTPGDVLVSLSLAELLLEIHPNDPATCKKVVTLVGDVENETPVHAALMLYKAKALRRLGLVTAARDALTRALRRKKDRPADLLRAIRYERAQVYEDLGQKSRARGEWEKLYADYPDDDVAERLGL